MICADVVSTVAGDPEGGVGELMETMEALFEMQ